LPRRTARPPRPAVQPRCPRFCPVSATVEPLFVRQTWPPGLRRAGAALDPHEASEHAALSGRPETHLAVAPGARPWHTQACNSAAHNRSPGRRTPPVCTNGIETGARPQQDTHTRRPRESDPLSGHRPPHLRYATISASQIRAIARKARVASEPLAYFGGALPTSAPKPRPTSWPPRWRRNLAAHRASHRNHAESGSHRHRPALKGGVASRLGPWGDACSSRAQGRSSARPAWRRIAAERT
jgi:hypothetical protein